MVLHLHRGDHLLVSGGLMDQPAALWFRVNEAGVIWQLLEKVASANENTDYSEAEFKTMEKIKALRTAR